MGLLDEVLAQAAQQQGMGNQQASAGPGLAKPLMLALGALLVGKMMGGGAQSQAAPAAEPAGAGIPDGGLVGGLGGLLQKLNDAGHGQVVKSWTSPGPSQPIDPNHLGAAIGPQNVAVAAQQAGLNEQELLQHLAQNLPQIVSKLTANGAQMPSLAQIAAALTQGQQRQ
jgi:uncharacterized protein YidB (DUF937 family)